MIGLEYILGLYSMQHIELAEHLGIKKQNINMWIKGKQKIPKKYLPTLRNIFHVDEKYFSKELDEIEKLEIQKEKLKRDLQPVIKKYDKVLNEGADYLREVPVYDKEEMNSIERSIEKAKLIERFKESIEAVDNHPFMDTYRIMVELLEKAGTEIILHKTIQGLAHYLNVLPGDIGTGEEQEEFEEALFEVLDDNNY
ncbi:helix-turn-helix domain-containing protein [Clostridium guangxiense]|uniref:helix-turn-helix domain-containing protein n=1 Tax=Clostridium guangxiense TaxID=1662055 RepID=UPI001E4C5847|nr:helix-turn-helix domain-containing protein [Clostridium guangxiense]MCD2348251.1 helix-turn-helix domain-containing protein [Clostridium guangxiense]